MTEHGADTAGCEDCRAWAGNFVEAFKREPRISTDGAFEVLGGYFNAYMVRCELCGTAWLAGYIEDFSRRPVEAEWGDRWWTMRALTAEQVEKIAGAKDTGTLDIRTFAAHRPGASWGELVE